MSYLHIPIDEVLDFPSTTNFNPTLLLIQTNKNIAPNSLTFFDNQPQSSFVIGQMELKDQDSLGQELEEQVNQLISRETTPQPKKKKKGGCICKKTKCLKMYCQCFASGKICSQQCACFNCFNLDQHEDMITKAKENIRCKNGPKQLEKGCTCKKSQCQKKYCQCFTAGILCSYLCKCEECANHHHIDKSDSDPSK